MGSTLPETLVCTMCMHGCDRWSTNTCAPRPRPSIAACLTWCQRAALASRATLCHIRGRGSWGLLKLLSLHFPADGDGGGDNAGGSGSGINRSVLLWLDIFAINQNPYAAKGALLSDDVANLAKVGGSGLTSVGCNQVHCLGMF